MGWRRLGLFALSAALWLLTIDARARGPLPTAPDGTATWADVAAGGAGGSGGGQDSEPTEDDEAADDDPPETADEAAGSPGEHHRGEDLSAYVLTMGPGDHPFFKFGHNALWIADRKTGRNRVYNYGSFRFRGSIFLRFWLGRFEYSLTRSSIRTTLRSYGRRNRSVSIQKLNLTADQKLQLYEFLRWNAKKENRYYHYDYYRDNCSTRVRDALDRVLGGRIRAAGQEPAAMTYRAHTLRLTANLLPEYVALHVVMGALIDQPINEWEEAFLPERLQQLLRKVTVLRDGTEVPLVAAEKVAVEADRPPGRTQPPAWLPYFLAAGLAVGGSLAWLGRAGRTRRWLRITTAVWLGLLGLLYGLLGTGFCLLWMLTDHEVAYANENTFHCAPWLLALPVLAVGIARGRPRATRRSYGLLAGAVGLSVLGVVLKVLPWFDQDNGQIIAFTLPTVVGMALAARWLSAAERGARPSQA